MPQFVVQAIKVQGNGRKKINYVAPHDNRYLADSIDGAALYTRDNAAQTVRDNMKELHPSFIFKVVAVNITIDKEYDFNV